MWSIKPNIVIIGGGFAGLYAAQHLGRKNCSVTLIDKTNFHLFQPLLYQVATGFLAPGGIAAPIRSIVAKLPTVRVIQAEVTGVDCKNKCVLAGDTSIEYDFLIVATGMTNSFFGHNEWESVAPGLKTIEDALRIRQQVLEAFERAEQARSDEERQRHLTFVIVGGGPTGVELAGAISELARKSMRNEFRNFDPRDSRILLLEGGERILSSFHPKTGQYVTSILTKMGVTVRTKSRVMAVKPGVIEVSGAKGNEQITTNTVLWAAGVKATPLTQIIAQQTSSECDAIGRIKVNSQLTLETYPEVYIVGDIANVMGSDGKSLPGVAPVAIQQGQYAARSILQRINNKQAKPFHYVDKGNMAVIGKGRAVAEVGNLRLTGLPAWLAWAFIHIYFLIEFENKLVVFVQWAWNYLTNKRGSRLVTKGNKS